MSVASALLVVSLGVLGSPGCSSHVQELGRDPEAPAVDTAQSQPAGEGFGAEWAMSEGALARDLACPLTRPIEGDECPARNTAPCTYHGEPEHAPDLPPLVSEGNRSTTLCMCMQSHRWRCAQGVTVRTLLKPPVEGAPCVDSMLIERAGQGSCRCNGGVLRCAP